MQVSNISLSITRADNLPANAQEVEFKPHPAFHNFKSSQHVSVAWMIYNLRKRFDVQVNDRANLRTDRLIATQLAWSKSPALNDESPTFSDESPMAPKRGSHYRSSTSCIAWRLSRSQSFVWLWNRHRSHRAPSMLITASTTSGIASCVLET